MKLKYANRCACGADCPIGTEVWMEQDDDGRWKVARCPACDDSLSPARVVADVPKSDITLAEALRRREIRENRKRGRA